MYIKNCVLNQKFSGHSIVYSECRKEISVVLM